MPDDPMNGAAPVSVIDPPRIIVELQPGANGPNVQVAWTDGTPAEFFVEAAVAILQARRQQKAEAGRPRLVLPPGLLR